MVGSAGGFPESASEAYWRASAAADCATAVPLRCGCVLPAAASTGCRSFLRSATGRRCLAVGQCGSARVGAGRESGLGPAAHVHQIAWDQDGTARYCHRSRSVPRRIAGVPRIKRRLAIVCPLGCVLSAVRTFFTPSRAARSACRRAAPARRAGRAASPGRPAAPVGPRGGVEHHQETKNVSPAWAASSSPPIVPVTNAASRAPTASLRDRLRRLLTLRPLPGKSAPTRRTGRSEARMSSGMSAVPSKVL